MNIQIVLVIVSFVVTTLLALGIIPILKKKKMGQSERDDGPQSHLSKQGTPTMGGIIFIICLVLVSVCTSIITKNYHILALAFVSVGFGLIGMVDDYKKLLKKDTKGLSPKGKMLGLLLISIAYVIYIVYAAKLGTDTYIPFLKMYINIPVWIYIPCAIFIMLGTTNAVNLTDGVDGLATTVCIIILTCITGIGMINEISEVSIFGSILIGSCLAFLIFNMHPAKVFMGDTGSLCLGSTMAAIAILTKHELSLALIGGVFVIETLSSIIQLISIKKFGHKIFLMAPLHHHFEKLGWQETDIVKLFLIGGFMMGMIAVYYGVWM